NLGDCAAVSRDHACDVPVSDRRAGSRQKKIAAAAAEISLAFAPRGQCREAWRRVLPDLFPFLAAEEEQLVFHNGSGQIPTEVVEPEFAFLRRKEVPRVERVIPDELEDAAMELIAAASRYYVHRSARVPAVLRRKVRGLDVDLANEINSDV